MRTLRTYCTRFGIDAPVGTIEQAVIEPERWLTGLPDIVALTLVTDGDANGIGRRVRVRVRTVVGYALTWETVLVDRTPGRLRWAATGDLEGEARWALHSRRDGAIVISRWRAHPTRRWMVASWPVASRLFVASHDVLVRRGAARLAEHLDARLTCFAPGSSRSPGTRHRR
jgi:hypothetical protein